MGYLVVIILIMQHLQNKLFCFVQFFAVCLFVTFPAVASDFVLIRYCGQVFALYVDMTSNSEMFG